MSKVTIQLNGEPFDIEEGLSLSELIAQLDLRPTRIAVELNYSVVPRSDYSKVSLKAGDKVEVVHFVGGG